MQASCIKNYAKFGTRPTTLPQIRIFLTKLNLLREADLGTANQPQIGLQSCKAQRQHSILGERGGDLQGQFIAPTFPKHELLENKARTPDLWSMIHVGKSCATGL